MNSMLVNNYSILIHTYKCMQAYTILIDGLDLFCLFCCRLILNKFNIIFGLTVSSLRHRKK